MTRRIPRIGIHTDYCTKQVHSWDNVDDEWTNGDKIFGPKIKKQCLV